MATLRPVTAPERSGIRPSVAASVASEFGPFTKTVRQLEPSAVLGFGSQSLPLNLFDLIIPTCDCAAVIWREAKKQNLPPQGIPGRFLSLVLILPNHA